MAARVLIVSYHFYPDPAVGAKRMSELARTLVAQGSEVVVIAADAEPDTELLERIAGVRVVRVPTPRKLVPRLMRKLPRRKRGAGAPAAADTAGGEGIAAAEPALREGFVRRLKRWYHSFEWLVDDKKLWGWRASRRAAALALERPFDCVISSGPPMSGHLAVLFARPFLRAPWIMDLRDPWTDDSDWLSHVHSGASLRINGWLERRCIRSAEQVLTTTPGYAARLRQRFPAKADRIDVIYNGFDQALEESGSPTGHLRLLYAGSLYYNRNPFPLLEALERLLAEPDVDRDKVSFLLVGGCDAWQGRRLMPWLREHGLDDRVEVRPPVAPAQVQRLLAEANVLVNFAQGQPRQIPAKMFEYIAAGREMLLLTEPDSDSARLARGAGAAEVVDPADPEAHLQALRALYRRYVREGEGYRMNPARVNEFSRAHQSARLLDLIALHGGARLATEES